jgi:hypothetical protein
MRSGSISARGRHAKRHAVTQFAKCRGEFRLQFNKVGLGCEHRQDGVEPGFEYDQAPVHFSMIGQATRHWQAQDLQFLRHGWILETLIFPRQTERRLTRI